MMIWNTHEANIYSRRFSIGLRHIHIVIRFALHETPCELWHSPYWETLHNFARRPYLDEVILRVEI